MQQEQQEVEEVPRECYLINAGLTSLSSLEEHQLTGVAELNLHSNQLSSLQGLPHHLLRHQLTELNLSSNEFQSLNVSELVHLPLLRSLDLSGNFLTRLDELPYLPALEKFSVAFNKISSLSGLDGFPALKNLDVRGNLLEDVEAFASLQVLSSLRNVQLSSSDGRHANPICSHEAKLISVFDSYFYLGTIDKRSRQEYANLLTEKTFIFNNEPQVTRPVNSTPNFDRAVERFRHRLKDTVDKTSDTPAPPLSSGTISGVEVFEDDSDSGDDNENNHVNSASDVQHSMFPKKTDRKSKIPTPQRAPNPWEDANQLDTSDRVKMLLGKGTIPQKQIECGSQTNDSGREYFESHVVDTYSSNDNTLPFFISKIFNTVNFSMLSFRSVQCAWSIWRCNTKLAVQKEELDNNKMLNAQLLLRAEQAEADVVAHQHANEANLDDLKIQLSHEKNRNSALQDRLISIEQEVADLTRSSAAEVQSLENKLADQKELTNKANDALSKQEKNYGESLQAITADVMQFTKVMEGKDAAIDAHKDNVKNLETTIIQLQNEIQELSSAKEQYVCQDCVKMKAFFESIQHDMQSLVKEKVQLEHDNTQIPVLKAELAQMKQQLTVTQLDFTKQVSDMQKKNINSVSKDKVTELEKEYLETIQIKDNSLVEKEQMVQNCLREMTSAKEALMEYDDKCLEMEKLLKEYQERADDRIDLKSELDRSELDLKKYVVEIKKKDMLILEMREHVVEVKNMLKKLAEKCRSLEYVNGTQQDDLSEARAEIKRLEGKVEILHEEISQRENTVTANVLLANQRGSGGSDSETFDGENKSMVNCDDSTQIESRNVSVHVTENNTTDDVVSREVFEEVMRDFDHLQSEYDEQAERLSELESHLASHEQKEDAAAEGINTLALSVDGVNMTPQDLHDAYFRQRTEHEEALNDMSLSSRIKDKMIDDQHNAIRRLKDRHRDDESRVQETIAILEEENEEVRSELARLEEQLDQSREQEKQCLKDLHEMEDERNNFRKECERTANEEIKPYRAMIQEKDDALEKVKTELNSICEVVSSMKSHGAKRDNEIKSLKKEIENMSESLERETSKYLKEKISKSQLLKEVQKMRSDISQSLLNKEEVIKGLKKSLRNKKLLLLESHEKIVHMEELFGTFQQLAASMSASPDTKVSLQKGKYSLPVPSHLLLNEGGLARTIQKYSHANKGLKESISDMSVVSSDSDYSINESNIRNDAELDDKATVNKENTRVKKIKQSSRNKSKKGKSNFDHNEPHDSFRNDTERSYSDFELSTTISAEILDVNDEATTISNGREDGSQKSVVDYADDTKSYNDQFYEKYLNDS